MNKLTNIVHSGWMTKSPPEQKLQAPLKFLRAKWKARFFVLHKPSGSLPDHYELSYYNSDQCTKKKGSIDLDQCEQIIESLDSEQYPFLLAVKTVCRGKVRTYYLATSTEDDMSNWVQCLCRVCGLKQEDTPTDIPDSRMSMVNELGVTSSGTVPVASPGKKSSGDFSSPIITQPTGHDFPSNGSSSSHSTLQSPAVLSTSPQSYVLLNECTTGDSYKRTESIDSVPEYQAPPPPQKVGRSTLGSNATTISSSKTSLDDNVFDPHEGTQRRSVCGNDIYDHPPPSDILHPVPLPLRERSPISTHSSVSERPDSADSGGCRLSDSYDVPPARRSHDSHLPSTALPTPPQRPPKPHGVSQSPYQNVGGRSPVSKNILDVVPSAPKSSGNLLSYDIPRTMNIAPPRESAGLDFAPPPPRHIPSRPGSHAYLNTVPGLGAAHGAVGDSSLKRAGESSKGVLADFMDRVPPVPRESDMGTGAQDLYKSPPLRPARSETMPRTQPSSTAWGPSGQVAIEAEQQIWSTTRTKSFKRNAEVSRSPRPARPPPLEPRRPPPPHLTGVASSSDDDDVSIDGNNTHHDISVVRMSSVPAAPERDMEPELKYLDLALEHPEPGRVQPAPHVHGSQTEYREIDFIKTKALQDVKKVRKLHGK